MGGICSGTSCPRCAAAAPTALFLELSCHPSGQSTQPTPSYQGSQDEEWAGPSVSSAGSVPAVAQAIKPMFAVCQPHPLQGTTLSLPHPVHRLFAGPETAWLAAASVADGACGLRTSWPLLLLCCPHPQRVSRWFRPSCAHPAPLGAQCWLLLAPGVIGFCEMLGWRQMLAFHC